MSSASFIAVRLVALHVVVVEVEGRSAPAFRAGLDAEVRVWCADRAIAAVILAAGDLEVGEGDGCVAEESVAASDSAFLVVVASHVFPAVERCDGWHWGRACA